MTNKVLVPVRYAAWLSSELGQQMQASVEKAIRGATVERLPRGFLIEREGRLGTLIERVAKVVEQVEADVKERYPVFHREMGPVFSGTLQVVTA